MKVWVVVDVKCNRNGTMEIDDMFVYSDMYKAIRKGNETSGIVFEREVIE